YSRRAGQFYSFFTAGHSSLICAHHRLISGSRGGCLIQWPPAPLILRGAISMEVKHTFLFTLVLGLTWTVCLFAYSTGPDTGLNGVFGPSINCTSCHNSFAPNSGNGGVSVMGLPSSWTPEIGRASCRERVEGWV